MKNNILTKTTLATLITLSLSACSHTLDDGIRIDSPSTIPSNTDKASKTDTADLKAQLDAISAKVDGLNNIDTQPLKDQLDTIKAKVDGLENTNTDDLKKDLAEVKDKVSKLKNTNVNTKPIEAQLKSIQDKVKGLNNTDTKPIEAQLKSIQDKVKGLNNTDTKPIEAQLKSIQDKVKGLNNTNTKPITDDLKTIQDKLAKLDTLQNTDTQQLENDLAEVKDKVSKLKNTDVDTQPIEDKLQAIQTKLDTLTNTDTSKLEDEIGTDENNKSVQSKLDALQDAIAKLDKTSDERVKEAEEKATNLQEDLEKIKKAKATAEKEKSQAETAKAQAETKKAQAETEKVKIEQAKKAVEKAKKAVEEELKKVEEAKKAVEAEKEKVVEEKKKVEAEKKVVEEKLKPFERKEDYTDGTVAYKAENIVENADANTSRDKFQKAIDKFSFDKIFASTGSVSNTSPDLTSAPAIEVEIDGKKTSVSVDRHDLEYSSIATMTGQIDTFEIPDQFTGELKMQTGDSTVLAVTGKPTDTSKISFDELKAQNKGDLTYEGRALYAVHVKEVQGANYKYDKDWNKVYFLTDLEKHDIMKSENSWAKPTFSVNLGTQKISGNMQFGTLDTDLKIELAEADIVEKGNQLQFAGIATAKQKEVLDNEWTKTYVKGGEQSGTYQGTFMGPNAEELAGKFLITQDYKQVRKANIDGIYNKYGNINGVFNAKKVTGSADQTYKKEKLTK